MRLDTLIACDLSETFYLCFIDPWCNPAKQADAGQWRCHGNSDNE
jgi:hypothetical protein